MDKPQVYILDQSGPDKIWVYDVGIILDDTIRWTFETGWQDWTHTSSNTFPNAWGVAPSNLHSGSGYVPPDPGDSCLWFDDDAAGSGAPPLQDTALSPQIVPNTTTTNWLKWGVTYNYFTGSEYLEVGIKYFDGSSWTVVPLKTYTADVSGMWDSVDVSVYNTYPRLQVYAYYDDGGTWNYYGAIDNVTINGEIYVAQHDVGCVSVVTPPEGIVQPGNYDVIGRVRNLGNNVETFDVTATIYDTTQGQPWQQVFNQTLTLTDFAVGGDTNLNFGTVTFDANRYYYTQIFTQLAGDQDLSNDTASVFSRTALGLGDVVFVMDAQTICNDNQLLGLEFDGERFYITGGGNASDPNKVYVVDTTGTLLWTLDQPSHSTGWGWRDIAWDGVYTGPDRIDTLWTSVNNNVDKFSIDLTNGTLIYHGYITGATNPNRALPINRTVLGSIRQTLITPATSSTRRVQSCRVFPIPCICMVQPMTHSGTMSGGIPRMMVVMDSTVKLPRWMQTPWHLVLTSASPYLQATLMVWLVVCATVRTSGA